MSLLMLRELPRYECLKEVAAMVPGMDPVTCAIYFNILWMGDVLARSGGEFLARYGLNQARLVILMLLDEAPEGSLRSSKLAEEANVSRATMTGLLDTMARADLVTRIQESGDRRATQVKITPKGHDLLKKAGPDFLCWASQKLAVLNEKEQDQLNHILSKIQQAFSPGATARPHVSL